jgi:hypothetical protein
MTRHKSSSVSAGVKQALTHFARNGRWGTCAACPRDGDGNKLPELCLETNRCGHWLELADILRIHSRELLEKKP